MHLLKSFEFLLRETTFLSSFHFSSIPARRKSNLVEWKDRLLQEGKFLGAVNAKLIANLLNLITFSLTFICQQKFLLSSWVLSFLKFLFVVPRFSFKSSSLNLVNFGDQIRMRISKLNFPFSLYFCGGFLRNILPKTVRKFFSN